MLCEYLKKIELASSKDEKRNLLQIYLRSDPSEDDLFELLNSEVVKYSIDLQYVLKKYFTDMEYEKLKNEDSGKYDWLLMLASFPSI